VPRLGIIRFRRSQAHIAASQVDLRRAEVPVTSVATFQVTRTLNGSLMNYDSTLATHRELGLLARGNR